MDLKWLKTSVLSLLGGGAAGAFQAMTDPSKYRFPEDLGTGKLWKYIFMGWALTLGGLLIHSPLGQKALGKSQEQMDKDKAELEALKAQFKPPRLP